MSSASLSNDLPRFLAAERERRGLTQSELGAKAGIAAGAISHFETGQRVPSLESMVKLADALDCSIDQLLGRESDAAPRVDPIFVRASRADSRTLDAVRRVTAALLREHEEEGNDKNSPTGTGAPRKTTQEKR